MVVASLSFSRSLCSLSLCTTPAVPCSAALCLHLCTLNALLLHLSPLCFFGRRLRPVTRPKVALRLAFSPPPFQRKFSPLPLYAAPSRGRRCASQASAFRARSTPLAKPTDPALPSATPSTRHASVLPQKRRRLPAGGRPEQPLVRGARARPGVGAPV